MKGPHSSAARLLGLTILLLYGAGAGMRASDRTFPSLEELDRIVSSTSEYDAAKQGIIDGCRHRLETAAEEQKPGLCNEMSYFYYAFQSDSALFYAHRAIDFSRAQGNIHEECTAKLNLAKIYQITGSHLESLTLLDSLGRSLLDAGQKAEMFSLYNTNYESLKSTSTDESLKRMWQDKAILYKDSLLTIDPSIFVICDKMKIEGRCKEALEVIKPYCDSLDADDPLVGIAAYVTSDLCHLLGLQEEEMNYLILSARSDLMKSNKEYISLTNLAVLLYEKGDITRAYNYLNRAVEDATFCKARQRIDQIAPMISIINSSYKKQNSRLLTILSVITGLLMLMAAVMLGLTWYLYRQRRHLVVVNQELENSKTMLEEANGEIREASSIKNTYITGLMLDCISRIEKFESYRKGLRKQVLAAEYDKLRQELMSNDIAEAEWKSFYHTFDTTFLSLFPTFVEELNKLLLPEHKLPVPEKKSLPPEARIYALIRLEIDSSEQIATLLRYSRATIYSYRSRTRLKALAPAEFENQIRKIASI